MIISKNIKEWKEQWQFAHCVFFSQGLVIVFDVYIRHSNFLVYLSFQIGLYLNRLA